MEPADTWKVFARPRISGGKSSAMATDVIGPKPPWLKPSRKRTLISIRNDPAIPVKQEKIAQSSTMPIRERRVPKWLARYPPDSVMSEYMKKKLLMTAPI